MQTFMRNVVRLPEDQVQLLRSLPAWQGRLQAAHTLVREMDHLPSYRFEPERIGRITMPTLLLLGGASPEGIKAPVEQLHQTIKGSSIAVLPGQGHVAMDTGSQLFLEVVLGFLN